MNYARHLTATPQSERADERQVQNSAGGFTFEVTPWQRLDRWLILGCEGGTYYASERKLAVENAKAIRECLALDGPKTVARIAEISEAGRAPENDPAIFALALAASDANQKTRAAALAAIPRVCRIGTHLFQFAESVNSLRGWGRGLRRAIGAWYESKSVEDLCYQVAKYEQRNGWSHRDLLRLAHPEPGPSKAAIYRYLVGAPCIEDREVKRGERSVTYPAVPDLPEYLAAFSSLKHADLKQAIQLVRDYRFTHEMVPSEHKNSPEMWEALLESMPMTAMIRNLAKMTQVGLLKPLSADVQIIRDRLGNEQRIHKARVHPIAMLSALKVYQHGHGERGKLTWTPVQQIIDALDGAFYLSFGSVEPSGKRTLLGLDVSRSMECGTIAGVPGLTPQLASAAMAMVVARTEPQWHMVGFSENMVDVPITPRMRLDEAIRAMRAIPFGGTDCALPMLYAAGNKIDVDTFQIYTDNETWFGSIHPHQALKAYRSKSGIGARLAVVACTATNFTIADPSDPGQLDVCGFDTATPNVLSSFSKGEF